MRAVAAPVLLMNMHAQGECMLRRPARRVCACMQTQAHVQLVERDARAGGQPDPYSVCVCARSRAARVPALTLT